MSFPYPEIKGDTYQPGFARGKRLRERITHNLEIYFKRSKVEGGLGIAAGDGLSCRLLGP